MPQEVGVQSEPLQRRIAWKAHFDGEERRSWCRCLVAAHFRMGIVAEAATSLFGQEAPFLAAPVDEAGRQASGMADTLPGLAAQTAQPCATPDSTNSALTAQGGGGGVRHVHGAAGRCRVVASRSGGTAAAAPSTVHYSRAHSMKRAQGPDGRPRPVVPRCAPSLALWRSVGTGLVPLSVRGQPCGAAAGEGTRALSVLRAAQRDTWRLSRPPATGCRRTGIPRRGLPALPPFS